MGTLVHVYERKIWIESDIWGNRSVMVQHDAPGEEPFCYCTFGYDYSHTSNSAQLREAERMALWLGAKEPIEHRARALDVDPPDPAPTNPAEIGSKSVEPRSEHWRKALKEYIITSCDSGANWIEQRARELAQEDKTP
jgi:hypothetical protein